MPRRNQRPRSKKVIHYRDNADYASIDSKHYDVADYSPGQVHEIHFPSCPGLVARQSAVNDYTLSPKGLHPIFTCVEFPAAGPIADYKFHATMPANQVGVLYDKLVELYASNQFRDVLHSCKFVTNQYQSAIFGNPATTANTQFYYDSCPMTIYVKKSAGMDRVMELMRTLAVALDNEGIPELPRQFPKGCNTINLHPSATQRLKYFSYRHDRDANAQYISITNPKSNHHANDPFRKLGLYRGSIIGIDKNSYGIIKKSPHAFKAKVRQQHINRRKPRI